MSMKSYNCIICSKEFKRSDKQELLGYAKYCSRKCLGLSLRKDDKERFWNLVNKDGPIVIDKLGKCWVHKDNKTTYWMFKVGGKQGKAIRAHVFAYKLEYGEFLKGLLVCHKCDNPPCVRPEHLFLGTHSDNSQDMLSKSRQSKLCAENIKTSKLLSNQVYEIKIKLRDNISRKEIAREYNVSKATIDAIAQNRSWNSIILEDCIE